MIFCCSRTGHLPRAIILAGEGTSSVPLGVGAKAAKAANEPAKLQAKLITYKLPSFS